MRALAIAVLGLFAGTVNAQALAPSPTPPPAGTEKFRPVLVGSVTADRKCITCEIAKAWNHPKSW